MQYKIWEYYMSPGSKSGANGSAYRIMCAVCWASNRRLFTKGYQETIPTYRGGAAGLEGGVWAGARGGFV